MRIAKRLWKVRVARGRQAVPAAPRRWALCVGLAGLAVSCGLPAAFAQTALTWQQVKDRFEAANPTLQAAQINVLESKAQEVTAYLRPNPDFTAAIDQVNPFSKQPTLNGSGDAYRPFQYALPVASANYLHERQHKRELRRESAQKGTAIAQSQVSDLERNLLFNLRSAFVQTLQAKALLANAKENLDYYDQALSINRDRFRAGDISQLDLNRLVLQRVQYESDLASAQVNLRTAKITLLTLLNSRTPVDQMDVSGPFDFSDRVMPLEEFRMLAQDARPDLKAAVQAIDKAQTDHRLAVANGSTDPSFGLDVSAQNPPIPAYLGFSINIPLRIFDRNQGEKTRTQIDIRRAERARDATQAQVFSDVDSGYYTLMSALSLLKPYKDTYLPTATAVRDTMSFSYQRGQAALVDYLDAQRDYRATQVAYINLVASYLTAAAQLNLAIGREVIP
ncbi:MAG: TolC family protein [Acidobacteriia bacterium]|nr:TolC family protein [Terriglobia bacterium]